MQCHKGCRLEHPLRAMSLVSWGVERLTRFSLSLYLFRVIWLNVYKVLLCLHCWGITTIRCPSMLAYGLANNNLVCIMNFNLSTTYADVQRIDRLFTNGPNLSLKTCSITICGNFISLRYVAIQGMKIYTGNLFVLPELL